MKEPLGAPDRGALLHRVHRAGCSPGDIGGGGCYRQGRTQDYLKGRARAEIFMNSGQ